MGFCLEEMVSEGVELMIESVDFFHEDDDLKCLLGVTFN